MNRAGRKLLMVLLVAVLMAAAVSAQVNDTAIAYTDATDVTPYNISSTSAGALGYDLYRESLNRTTDSQILPYQTIDIDGNGIDEWWYGNVDVGYDTNNERFFGNTSDADMDYHAPLDDDSGEVWQPLSSVNGTNNGATLGQTGQLHQSAYFNAANEEYIDTNINDPLDLNTNFTITAWIKRDSTEAYPDILGTHGDETGYIVNIRDTDVLSFYNGNGFIESSLTITGTSSWHFIAVKYDGSAYRFRVNSNTDAVSNNNYPPANGNTAYIGARNNYDQFFDGKIDDLRVWKGEAKSDAFISDLYDATSPSIQASLGAEQITNNNSFSVSAYDEVTGNSISKFNVSWASLNDSTISGTNSTTDGTAVLGPLNTSHTYEINVSSQGYTNYINSSVPGDIVSMDVKLFGERKLTAHDLLTNESINEFTVSWVDLNDTSNNDTSTVIDGTYTAGPLSPEHTYSVEVASPGYENYSNASVPGETNSMDIPLYGEIDFYVYDGISNATLTNTSVSWYSTENNTINGTNSTENGNLTAGPLTPKDTYDIELASPGYENYTNSSLSGNISDMDVVLYRANSLMVNLYNENDFSELNDTLTLDASTDEGTETYNFTNTSSKYIENLSTASYTLHFTDADNNLSERYYYIDVRGDYHQLNAFFLTYELYQYTTFKSYCDGSTIANVMVSLQRSDPDTGNYVTVAQRRTDDTGEGTITVDPTEEYRLVADHLDYNSFTATLTPQEDVSFDICQAELSNETVSYNWTSEFDYFDYRYIPKQTLIFQSRDSLGMEAKSESGSLGGFGMEYNNKTAMINGSPSGGVVNLSVNLSDTTGPITVQYWWQVGSFGYYNTSKTYYVQGYETGGNLSLTSTLVDFHSDMGLTGNMGFWHYIIVTLFVIGMMALLQDTLYPSANALVGMGVYMVFAIPPISWYSPMLIIPSVAIILAAYIYQGM